ncbi:hypothetical protein EON65_20040, partial [archaeon]
QVKILRLLRLLGKSNEEASEQMNDVLAQVATNTETTKNAGNAILYECVQTIMEVESDSSLRVLAINILGRFLLNRDNNIRYVALNSLSKVVSEDNAAVQRHRSTIVDCLKDPDVSIRQRALELIYQLVNEQNVVPLTTELLNYLIVAQSEHKASLVSKMIQIIETYSPNKRWRVDTVITMLSLAGNIADESVPRTAIIFIAQADGLQAYATHRLFRCLQEDAAQMGLLQVAIWCIGEYGGSLLRDCAAPDNDGTTQSYSALSEEEVVALLEKCSKHHSADVATKALVINALMKLTVRFSASITNYVVDLIGPYRQSLSLELQQRSSEYCVLLGNQWGELRRQLLEKMPVLDEAEIRKRRAAFEDSTFSDSNSPKPSSTNLPAAANNLGLDVFGGLGLGPTTLKPAGGSSLLDLDDIFGAAPRPAVPASAPAAFSSPMTSPTPAVGGADLLSQIFSSPTAAPIMPTPAPASSLPLGNLTMSMPPTPPVAPAMPTMIATKPATSYSLIAYDKAGLQVGTTVDYFLCFVFFVASTFLITMYFVCIDKLGGQQVESLRPYLHKNSVLF